MATRAWLVVAWCSLSASCSLIADVPLPTRSDADVPFDDAVVPDAEADLPAEADLSAEAEAEAEAEVEADAGVDVDVDVDADADADLDVDADLSVEAEADVPLDELEAEDAPLDDLGAEDVDVDVDVDVDAEDAGDAGGVIVRGAGMATVNGAVLSGGSYRVHDMGFEGGGPLCAGTVCAWGGMVP
jgi:hypothetical protein